MGPLGKQVGMAALAALALVGCSRRSGTPAPAEVEATPTEAPPAEAPLEEIIITAMVGGVSIEPHDFNTESTIRAVVKSDPSYTLRYEWEINGRGLGLTEADTLSGRFSRGDLVRVTVTPYNAGVPGIPMASRGVRVNNAAPQFTGSMGQGFQLDGYVVPVRDPDGDSLSFSLVGGPPGLSIDPSTGRLSWVHAPSAGGDATVYQTTVLASDGHEGEVKVTFPVKVQ